MTTTNEPQQHRYCSKCDTEPLEGNEPCPTCGGTARTVKMELTVTVTQHADARYSAKHSGGGKPFITGRSGSEIFRDTGRLHFIEQVVDRLRNLYRKRITDVATGQVIRDEQVPLSEHQGFGSAKQRKGKEA